MLPSSPHPLPNISQWLFSFVCFFKKEAGFGAPVLRLGSKESTSSAAGVGFELLHGIDLWISAPISFFLYLPTPPMSLKTPLFCVVVVAFLQLVCLLVEISGTLLSTH
jgi:hypothetical protein